MTVWNIHFLNARDDLTGVLPEIRAAARDAVARVADHAELPRFDLVLRAQVEGAGQVGARRHAGGRGRGRRLRRG